MSVQHLTSQNFDTVLADGKPVLVDFFATWCGPCKMLAPVLEQLSEEFGNTAAICKIDVDQEMTLAQRYGVQSVPTLVLFKDGKEAARLVGYHSKNDLAAMLG